MIAQYAELHLWTVSHKLLANFLFLSLADQQNELQIYDVKMEITQESKVLKLCKAQVWQSETKQGSHLNAAA